MRKVMVIGLAIAAALTTGGAATAQRGSGCGGTPEPYVVTGGNGYVTTHYPNGTWVTTYSFTDQNGQAHTVVVEQGFDQPGTRDQVNC